VRYISHALFVAARNGRSLIDRDGDERLVHSSAVKISSRCCHANGTPVLSRHSTGRVSERPQRVRANIAKPCELIELCELSQVGPKGLFKQRHKP
jgi:hypothetical protein